MLNIDGFRGIQKGGAIQPSNNKPMEDIKTSNKLHLIAIIKEHEKLTVQSIFDKSDLVISTVNRLIKEMALDNEIIRTYTNKPGKQKNRNNTWCELPKNIDPIKPQK